VVQEIGEDAVGLGDKLHVGVLDGVVHHLHQLLRAGPNAVDAPRRRTPAQRSSRGRGGTTPTRDACQE
jgi:hypothetical protein